MAGFHRALLLLACGLVVAQGALNSAERREAKRSGRYSKYLTPTNPGLPGWQSTIRGAAADALAAASAGGSAFGPGPFPSGFNSFTSASALSLADSGFGLKGGKGAVAAYPPAVGFAPAQCAGTPFCVPSFIPPTYAPAIPVCPPGFLMDGSGMCYTAKALCPPGSQPLDGQCCAEEPRNVCWAALGACPGGCTSMEPICSPSKPYSDVIAHVSVEAVSNPSPKEAAAGVAFFKLGLPKLDLVKNVLIAGKGIAKAIEEKVVSVPLTVLAKTKEILGKGKGATGGVVVKAEAYAKAGVVPKCFQKCCQTVPDLVCVAPKIDKAVVPPSLTCPPGCSPADGDKCLCAPGGPCPCPPGTKECPFAGGRMCVSLDLCFGLDQCKMMSLLAPHLPILSCPTPLGGGRAALASAFASASAAGN